MGSWVEKQIEEVRRNRHKHLQLGWVDLVALPEAVPALTWLEPQDISVTIVRSLSYLVKPA